MKIVLVGTSWCNMSLLTDSLESPCTKEEEDPLIGYTLRHFCHQTTSAVDAHCTDIDIDFWEISTDSSYMDVAEAAVIDADALIVCVAGDQKEKCVQRKQLKFIEHFRKLPASRLVPVISIVSTVGVGRTGALTSRALRMSWPAAWSIVELKPSPSSYHHPDRVQQYFIGLFDVISTTCGIGDELIRTKPVGFANEAIVLHSNVCRSRQYHNPWDHPTIPGGSRMTDVRCCCLQS